MHPSLHRALVALIAAATTTVLWLVPAQAAPADRYAGVAVGATNARRADHELTRLRVDPCLQRYADTWARHLARHGRLVHQDLGPILRRCRMRMVGENIAVGYPTGRAVVRAWMKSPGHRANILRPRYRLVAIGAARDAEGRWWSSQVFGRR